MFIVREKTLWVETEAIMQAHQAVITFVYMISMGQGSCNQPEPVQPTLRANGKIVLFKSLEFNSLWW